MVAFLRPRVGEQDQHLLQRARRNRQGEQLDRVVLDDAQIGQSGRGGREQAVADPWRVYLDAQKVPLGMGLRQRDQGNAIAEADLHRDGRGPSERLAQVERSAREIDARMRASVRSARAAGPA